MCLGSMQDHGLAADGGVEAARDTTEHGHPEVWLDVFVQCFVTHPHDTDRRGRNHSLFGLNKYAH